MQLLIFYTIAFLRVPICDTLEFSDAIFCAFFVRPQSSCFPNLQMGPSCSGNLGHLLSGGGRGVRSAQGGRGRGREGAAGVIPLRPLPQSPSLRLVASLSSQESTTSGFLAAKRPLAGLPICVRAGAARLTKGFESAAQTRHPNHAKFLRLNQIVRRWTSQIERIKARVLGKEIAHRSAPNFTVARLANLYSL